MPNDAIVSAHLAIYPHGFYTLRYKNSVENLVGCLSTHDQEVAREDFEMNCRLEPTLIELHWIDYRKPREGVPTWFALKERAYV